MALTHSAAERETHGSTWKKTNSSTITRALAQAKPITLGVAHGSANAQAVPFAHATTDSKTERDTHPFPERQANCGTLRKADGKGGALILFCPSNICALDFALEFALEL